jgi:ABC-2 type transport system permease protein
MNAEELRAIRLVFQREYSLRVRSLSFLASTFLTPLFFLLIAAAPALFAAPHLMRRKRIVIACAAPALADDIRASFQKWPLGRYEVTTVATMTADERRVLTAMVRKGRIHAFLWIDDAAIVSGGVAYVSREPPDFLEKGDLRAPIDWAITRQRLERRGLKPREVDAALKPVELAPVPVGDSAGARGNDGEMAAFVVTVMLITMLETSLLSYGIIVMRSVLEDKASRVIELLLCAATPRALMAGKVIGVGAVSFTQVAIWAVIAAVGAAAGARLTGIGIAGAVHLSAPHIAFCVIFYLLGFILYSSLYAALGAAFNSVDEAQYWNFLLTLPLLFSGIAAWSLIEQPDSAVAIALSIFPLSAPVMMSMRIAAGVTPVWQAMLALALLGGAIWLALAISSRIYRVGILMYGKKPALREIARWLRYA